MDYRELSSKVKSKYPGAYDDMDDRTLAQKIVAKHPEYSDTTFDDVESGGFGDFAKRIGMGAVNLINKPSELLGEAIQKTGIMENPAYKHSVPFMALKAQGAVTGLYDSAGTKLAEGMAERGMNPTAAAAIGTTVSMAPDIGMSAPAAAPLLRGGGLTLPKLAKPIRSGLRDFAEEQTAKAAGARIPQLTAEEIGRTRQIARVLKDKGIVGPLNSSGSMYKRLLNTKSQQGKLIDSVVSEIDNAGLTGASGRDIANQIRSRRSKFIPDEVANTEGTSYALADKKLEEAALTAERWGDGPLTMGQLRRLKQSLQGIANFDSESRALRIPKEAARTTRRILKGNVESNSKLLGKPELSTTFDDANRNYNLLEEAEEWISGQAGRENAASAFPLGDYGPTIAGATTAGAPGAGAAFTAKKFYDKLGNQLAAYSADALAPIAEKVSVFVRTLRSAAQAGPEALLEANNVLLQSDPDFALILKKLTSQEPKPILTPRYKKSAALPQEESQQEAVKVLDEDTAREYLTKAKGDKAKARKLALADGWVIS